MAPESIADEARSDEAVRRIREESRRRIERQNGWRAFSSLCALASLAGGISLAALNAREARLEQLAAAEAAEAAVEEARSREHAERAAAEREQRARVAEACAKRDAALRAIDEVMHQSLAAARTTHARAYARAHAAERRIGITNIAAGWGCDQPAPAPLPAQPTAVESVGTDRGTGCLLRRGPKMRGQTPGRDLDPFASL